MDRNDFRCMWRGQIKNDAHFPLSNLVKPFQKTGTKQDRAVLLLHGFSSSPAVFRLLFPKLCHYDTVICPLLPGHGESIKTFSQTLAKDWLHAAESICQELIEHHKTVDVIGLSLGGLLACHLSQKFQLNHLYLLAPALALRTNLKRAKFFARFFYALGFRHIRNRAGNLCSKTHCEIAYRQLPLTTVIELLSFIEAFDFHPPRCPTDLFLGYHDEVVCSKRVAKLFTQQPMTNIHWLEDSAHVLPLDNDLERIVACIQANQLNECEPVK